MSFKAGRPKVEKAEGNPPSLNPPLPQPYLKTFRCLYRWCPPLPIPNREVKPTRADGTAVTRGRVGRCQILKETL
jgi:hypothetical protein